MKNKINWDIYDYLVMLFILIALTIYKIYGN